MTVTEVLDLYEREVVPTVISQCRIVGILRTLRSFFVGSIVSVDESKVAGFRSARALRGIRGTTVNKELGVLMASLGHAKRKGLTNHAVRVPMVRTERRSSVVGRDDIQRLIDSADDLRAKVYIALLFITGQRKTALQTLRRDQIVDGVIEFERSQDVLASRRKRRARTPVTPQIQILLERLVAFYGVTDYVFPDSINGFSNCRHKLDRWFVEASAKAGVNCSPHILRHSCATVAINSGASIFEVSALLGHSNTRITEETYVKRQPSQIVKSVTALGNMVAVA